MNRRSFLTSAGAAACVATGGLGRSRKLFAQGSLNVNLLNSATDQNAQGTANMYANYNTPENFYAMAGATSQISQYFSDISLDSQLRPAISGLTAGQINLSTIDPTVAVNRIKNFEPAMTVQDANSILSLFTGDPSKVPQALANLQTNGIVPTLQSAIFGFQHMAAAITPPDQVGFLSPTARARMQSATYYPDSDRPHLRRVQGHQRAFMSLPVTDQGGGIYGANKLTRCQIDTVMGLTFGTELVILGIVCLSSGPGVVICAPVMGLVLTVITVAWAGAHAVMCGL